ncbi:superoxide dismutase family protein [Streptomyces beihaiensis]|uniref:Superoxide dismutase family protein n=1 Tax=Streptomyces beihaiensis TaxID=2984495 RepID=A0ABT3TTB8_9ACTN|nr:superoxide dismutase family protein [Streptomyces beihaiensis]MCX3060030.1 superoxide dismutase family protein [Streptomyces beihaiensis]
MVRGAVGGVLAGAVLVVAGGGAVADAGTDVYGVRTAARFSPPTAFIASSALTYDQQLVPAAAAIEVSQRGGTGRGMTVSLSVDGLAPGHAFGAHVHQKPCGADPRAAGGHFQHVVDPEQENAANEVWLDFTTDGSGRGAASVHKAWGLRPGEAGSVVIHDAPGTEGKRIACFTVPFVAQP